MLPAYFANMAPVIFKGVPFLAKPIDFGIKLNKKRLFGQNKTIRGLLFGVLAGILIAYLQFHLTKIPFFSSLNLINYTNWLFIGFLLGLGAILGDMIESSVKRQLNLKPGKPFIPFDQLDFVIGALILISFTGILTWKIAITVLIISPILHILTNHVAYYTHIRNEKW